MSFLMSGLAVLTALVLLGWLYVSVPPRSLIRGLRIAVGVGLMVVGGVMMLAGRWGLGLGAIAFGLSALATGRLGPIDLGGGARSPGSTSRVRTRMVEMELDHDTGAMEGRVLSGPFSGRSLGDLDDGEVLDLFRSAGADGESAALLAAYLDRRMPGWRDDVEEDTATGTGGAPDTGAMTEEQANEILGLSPGAGRGEIRAAHRRLMKRVHPDKGGSDFLAAKINEAKDRLLRNHR